MARTGGKRNSRRRARWRDLGFFWLGTLALLGAGAATLQYLGPPDDRPQVRLARGYASEVPGGGPPVVITSQRLAPPVVSGRDTPGPTADPDPALLEPVNDALVGLS